MHIQFKYASSALLTALLVLGGAPAAQAYGPEGLFGGRPQPDSSLVLGEPVELRNDRPERAESVLDHPRADFDPAPIEMGSFELFPTLELGETYDDNIYAAKSSKRDDMIGTVRPIVSVFSNWNRHALSVTTFGDVNYYSEHADESYKNGVMDVNGRYDIASQEWLSGRAGYQRLTEQRSSPNASNNTSEPTTFGLAKGGLTFYRGAGAMKLNADYDVKRFDYDNTPLTDGGDLDNGTRNRDEHVVGATLGYDVTGNFRPYVHAAFNARNYDDNATHESTGGEGTVGAIADFGGITSLDLFAGWMQQNYDDFVAKKKVTAPKIGGRLDWNVTGLTSVVLEANRTIEETTLTGYNSFLATGGSATITHELLRNVLIEGDVAYTRDDFNGTGDRSDDIVTAGLGTRYLINRNLYTDVLYNWERRYSDAEASEYLRNMGTVRLGVRL